MVRRSSCGPIAWWILARTILLWSSAVRVHGSQAYRKMNVTWERISLILELREILLSLKTVWTTLCYLEYFSPNSCWRRHEFNRSVNHEVQIAATARRFSSWQRIFSNWHQIYVFVYFRKKKYPCAHWMTKLRRLGSVRSYIPWYLSTPTAKEARGMEVKPSFIADDCSGNERRLSLNYSIRPARSRMHISPFTCRKSTFQGSNQFHLERR